MRESRTLFKSRLKWCQNHEEQIKMDIIASKHAKRDFRGFWKKTNKQSIRPGLPVSVNGISDTKEIANLFKNHFVLKSPLGNSCVMLDAELRCGKVGTRFSAKDVAKIIRSTTRGKSPGHDGLSIEHLQYAGPHLPRALALLYNLCIGHSYLPSDLMRTIVVPIVKSRTGDLSDKGNYRPISLATAVAKVLDGLLDAQLNARLVLHDNQFGFRPGLSTESAVLCLKQAVRYYTKRRTPVFACFLDLSRAFDLVSYDILWKKLEAISLPIELISIFKHWYGNQINNVRWAGVLSEPYQLECGVRQGGLTSPALFNLYMNALVEALSSHHVGCHIDGVCVNNLSYADDMVLLSASVGGIRTLLATCERYVAEHGLMYNVQKSQYIVFEAGTKYHLDVPPIRLSGVPLERVEQFKYLGHLVTTDLKDNADIERERRALSVRANMIARRFARCTADVKVTLFRAFCTTFYTCSLWENYSQATYGALRVQFNNAFRKLMGLPWRCSASGMFAAARVDCFYTIMRKRAASLVSRVMASPNRVLRMVAGRVDCPYVVHCCQLHVSPYRVVY